MARTQNFKIITAGVTAETDTGLSLGASNSAASVINVCLDGTTGTLILKHVFEDGTERDLQTVALAAGVLGLVTFHYKVPSCKIYFTTVGAGTLRLDTTFSK